MMNHILVQEEPFNINDFMTPSDVTCTYFSIYQVDLNEYGAYLLTSRTYNLFVKRLYSHLWNLIRDVYLKCGKSKSYEFKFILVMRTYNLTTSQVSYCHFGFLKDWKSKVREWFVKKNTGSNIYIETVYILAFDYPGPDPTTEKHVLVKNLPL